MPVDESQSHLIHPDKTKIQVLKDVIIVNDDGTETVGKEWDEAATYAAYAAYVASLVK